MKNIFKYSFMLLMLVMLSSCGGGSSSSGGGDPLDSKPIPPEEPG